MTLALFDLDHTLLDGDSDYLWGEFLCDQGVVDRAAYQTENARYYREYHAGTMDIHEFLQFGLRPLAAHVPAQLYRWRAAFVAACILPIIPPAARDLLARHQAQGHQLAIVTASNRFITEPIAAELGVATLLASEPEMADGRYTGRVAGTPCYREGKVSRVREWLAGSDETLADSWFYSDSHNDLPLLQQVSHPVAVNPDPVLAAHAGEHGWPVLHLHAGAGDPRAAQLASQAT